MKIYHFSVITCSFLLSVPLLLLGTGLCVMLPLLGFVAFVVICLFMILDLRKLSIRFNMSYGVSRIGFSLCATSPAVLVYAVFVAVCFSGEKWGVGMIAFVLAATVCLAVCVIAMICLLIDAAQAASDAIVSYEVVCDSEEAQLEAEYYLEHGEIISCEVVYTACDKEDSQ